MKVIDLTQKICNNMPVFSKDELPELKTVNTVNKDDYMMTCIKIYSHNGTHMDAPAHVINNGITLDKISIENFIGSAVVIDCRDLKNNKEKVIDYKYIENNKENADKAEFIIFNTGYSKSWGKKEYFEECPVLSKEVADYLVEKRKKGIGIDLMSLDEMNSVTLPIHKILLKNNVLIVENLTNLDRIGDEIFIFSAMPLKYQNADGAPVRALAQII